MRHEQKNLHLPLPPDVHARLLAVASAKRQPATVLVREVLKEWLDSRRRAELHDAIREYASAEAGTERDLDPLLESAASAEMSESETATGAGPSATRRRRSSK